MDYNTEISGNTPHCNIFFPCLFSADVLGSLRAFNGLYKHLRAFTISLVTAYYNDDYRYLNYQEWGRYLEISTRALDSAKKPTRGTSRVTSKLYCLVIILLLALYCLEKMPPLRTEK